MESAGRSVLAFDEPSRLLDRIKIDPAWKIVLEEDRDDQGEPDHECEAGEVVRIFRKHRDVRERVRADHRQEQYLSEDDVKTGKTENDEGDRCQPMGKPLKGLEAKDLLP